MFHWVVGWAGGRLITPMIIRAGSAASARMLSAEMAATANRILANRIVQYSIGHQVSDSIMAAMKHDKFRYRKLEDGSESSTEIPIQVEVNDLEVKEDLRNAKHVSMTDAPHHSVKTMANDVANRLKALVPSRTGHLKGSIGYRDSTKTAEVFVGYGIKYRVRTAHFIELGTAPHTIYAGKARYKRKPKKVLAYRGRVYGKYARHPGTKGLFLLKKVTQDEQVRTVDTYKIAYRKRLEEELGK